MYRILFVCTGNICRSPTAEAVFRHKTQKNGVEQAFHVESAGIHGYHVGESPDSRTMAVAQERGINMYDQTARKVCIQDFQEFDLILAMDKGHYESLNRMKPSNASAQIDLFLNYHPSRIGMDVPDPYYSNNKAFVDVFNLINEVCDAMIAQLS